MTINFSDFPSLIILAALTLAVALPVKLAASMLGATHNGLVRSFMAVFMPIVMVVVLSNMVSWIVVLYPFILLFSIQLILGTSFIGSVGVVVVTVSIYYFVITQFVSGISIT